MPGTLYELSDIILIAALRDTIYYSPQLTVKESKAKQC